MSLGSSLTGISVSGLGSGIDTDSLINQLMQLESIPVRRMQARQAQLTNRLELYGQLQSKLTAIATAASGLNTNSAFDPVSASLSDSTVASVSVTSGATVGQYALTVAQLAKAHKVSSANQASASAALNKTGEFVVNGKSVKVVATDSLASIAAKVNGANAGVTASIIDGGSSSAYLTLSANKTGSNSKIQAGDVSGTLLQDLGLVNGTLTVRDPVANGYRSLGFSSATTSLSNLTGSQATGTFDVAGHTISVDFAVDTLDSIVAKVNAAAGPDGVTASVVTETIDGQTASRIQITGAAAGTPTGTNGIPTALGFLQAGYVTQVTAAQNASYTLDGVSLTSSTNAVSGVIPGVTLTLLKESASTTVNLSRDTSKIKASFKSYVDAVNGFMDFVKANATFDTESFASGPLFGDNVATQAVSSVQSALFQTVPGGVYESLADIGFDLDSDGKLTLDEGKLDQSLSANAEAVKKLMVSHGTSVNPDLAYVSSTSRTKDPGDTGFLINVTQLATKALTKANIVGGANRGGEILTFSGKAFSTEVQLTIDAGKTLSDIASQINADTRLNDKVVASVDTDGKLKIEALKYGSATEFVVKSNFAEDVDTSGIGTGGGQHTVGVDIAGTINGEEATGTGQYLLGKDGNASSAGLQVKYSGTSLGDVGIIDFNRGLAPTLLGSLESMTDITSGLVTATKDTVQKQIDDLSDRITSFQSFLEVRQQTLRQKFLAMETAITRLKQQQAQLGGFTAG